MDLISIIVPVYGVEAYIVECIESLINQSYKNIEILLIDDQSPDKCPEICEKYAEIDKRIKVIHKENGGAGSARNVGLRNYRGEYVCFVDGDDYVDENYIQVLYDAISKNNADIAVIDYEYLYKNKVEKNDLPIQNEKLSNTEYLKQFLTRWNTGMMTNKLFKRSILKNIFFVEGRRIDDEFFTYQAVMNSKFIVQKQDVLYIYRMRASSVMNTGDKHYEEMLNDRIDYFTQRYKEVTSKYPQLKKEYLENYMDNLIQLKKKKNYACMNTIMRLCYLENLMEILQAGEKVVFVTKKINFVSNSFYDGGWVQHRGKYEWRKYDDIVDYVLIDYLILLGYKNFQQIRELIDDVPDNNQDIFEMYQVLDKPYSKELYERLTKQNIIHKLTYKIDLKKETADGQETLYAHLLREVYGSK